jgi:hypothetical protein
VISIEVPGIEVPVGDEGGSHRIPAWRIAAGAAVLAGFVLVGALLVPVYLHNLALEKFLRETKPAPEQVLRQEILDKGRSLGLDIVPENLRIRRSPMSGARARFDVRYAVRVTLPLYTVDLHFASNIAGQ